MERGFMKKVIITSLFALSLFNAHYSSAELLEFLVSSLKSEKFRFNLDYDKETTTKHDLYVATYNAIKTKYPDLYDDNQINLLLAAKKILNNDDLLSSSPEIIDERGKLHVVFKKQDPVAQAAAAEVRRQSAIESERRREADLARKAAQEEEIRIGEIASLFKHSSYLPQKYKNAFYMRTLERTYAFRFDMDYDKYTTTTHDLYLAAYNAIKQQDPEITDLSLYQIQLLISGQPIPNNDKLLINQENLIGNEGDIILIFKENPTPTAPTLDEYDFDFDFDFADYVYGGGASAGAGAVSGT
jgi:hypothetical protein